MKKNFTACVFTANFKSAKCINLEVNEFLNTEGVPVPGVYFVTNEDKKFVEIFLEFKGVIFPARTYSESTFYFREAELSAFYGPLGADIMGAIRARRIFPSYCVLLAIQKAGTPEEYREACEIRAAIIEESEAEDRAREAAEREAEERKRQEEAAELEKMISEGRDAMLAGLKISGDQFAALVKRYGVKVHPRTLHNINRVNFILPGELSYSRAHKSRKMNADGVFQVYHVLEKAIKAEAAAM